jgi:chloramphenicol 3-O phosphotransferase
MEQGTIILLNGVSSSGKTTLARALVERLPVFFHLGLDDFDSLLGRMEDRPHQRLIPVATEVFFHQTVAMFSDAGVPLIVDHILHDTSTRAHCLRVLATYPVLFVGVHCPVEALAQRESARGDRRIGQGRQQLAFVHRQEIYDVEVNTELESMAACCDKIIARLQSGRDTSGWLQTCALLQPNVSDG